MAARKWLTRGLSLVLAATLVFGGFWLNSWVKPSRIRQQLIAQLQEELPGVDVEVESARLRLLGGISVAGLKLTRRDDPKRTPFLIVPSAIIYHDKEQLGQGRLVVRKVELQKPVIRLERDAKGRWNVDSLTRPGAPSGGAMPLLAINHATIICVDQRAGAQPLAEFREVDLTVVNDPRPVLAIQGSAKHGPAGPFSFRGRVERPSGHASGTFEFQSLNFGPDFQRLLAQLDSDAAAQVKGLEGGGTARLDLAYINAAVPVLSHDLHLELTGCRYQNPQLPLLFEDIALKARCRNGHLTIEKATAHTGPAEVTLSLEMLSEDERAMTIAVRKAPLAKASGALLGETSVEPDPIQALEERLTRLHVSISHLALGPELLRRMPPKLQKIDEMFAPKGSISLTYEMTRAADQWRKRFLLHPEGLTATCQYYRYPMTDVRGTLEQVICNDKPDQLDVNLTAVAAGQPVVFKGKVVGERPNLDVQLHVTGQGMPLDDDRLIAALPEPYPDLVRRLHPGGRADIEVQVRHNAETRRDYGSTAFDNTFTVTMLGASINYEVFPYQLDDVTGTLVIRTQPWHPTRLPPSPGLASPRAAAPNVGLILFRNLRARHNGATLHLEGRKEPTTGGTAITMHVRGDSVPFDDDLLQAVSALQLGHIWETYSPRGRMNCVVQARVFERAGAESFTPSEDLELNFAFAGPTILPRFFPYLLTDSAGRLGYKRGQVLINDFTARHGTATVQLPVAEVLFRPEGGYWADLRDVTLNPLVIDKEFLAALPRGLRSACQDLQLQGPMAIALRRMVVDDRSAAPPGDLPEPGQTVRGYPPEERAPQVAPRVPGSESEFGSERSSPSSPPPQPETRWPMPVIYWDGKLIMEGAALKTGIPWEGVYGTFASRGRYDSDRLGRALGNLELRQAAIFRQPLTDIHARLEVDPRQPDVVRVPELRAGLYGGELGGEGQLTLTDSVQYKLKLNASRIRLDELVRQQKLGPNMQLEGLATAQLYLQNPIDLRTGRPVLEGGGTLDVPKGRLLNLPLILDLLKFIKGRIPDETAFDEAHALFRIRGERVVFGQLDLMGNAVSLGGEGEMNLDGSDLKLEFYTVWSRMNHLLPEPLTELTAAMSKQLFKFVVRGKAGGPFEIKKEPVPLIVEPIRRVMNRMKAMTNAPPMTKE